MAVTGKSSMENDAIKLYSVCKVDESGSGAYATLLMFRDKNGKLHEKSITQGETFAGRTRLQLRGIVEGLEFVHRPCDIEVNTDSKFIIDTIRNNWLEKWVENDWKRGRLQPVQNVELWTRLVNLLEIHNIIFKRIEEDSQNEEVAKCDTLVEDAYRNTVLIGKHMKQIP